MTPQTLDFWYDFASPYAYLSAQRIDGLARENGVDVRYRPFLLGPIFRSQGWTTSPFNLYPAKGTYMWRDVARRAAQHGIAFRRPQKFPVYSLYATRIALLAADEEWCLPFVRSVFRANFVDDQDIGDPECIESLLVELGIDGATVLRDASADDIKDQLRAQTEQAMDMGIFGAPTFMVGDEMLWGDDRMEDALAMALTGPATIDDDANELGGAESVA